MRSLIQIYALAVCFATLMCLVVALGIGIYDLVQISAPQFTLPYYEFYQSDENFAFSHPNTKELPQAEIARRREQALADAILSERRGAMQSGVFVLIILAIDIVVFGVHWWIGGKDRSATQSTLYAS